MKESQGIAMVRRSLTAAVLAAVVALPLATASADQKQGMEAVGFNEVMGLDANAKLPYSCQYLASTGPQNILYPGEGAEFTFRLANDSEHPIRCQGKVELIPYGTTRRLEDNSWSMFRNGDVSSKVINVDIAPKGTQDLAVTPDVPGRLGGYALVVDLGKDGRSFITTFVRTFDPGAMTIHYPQITCDMIVDANVVARLGFCPNRMFFSYTPTTRPDFSKIFEQKCAKLEEFKKDKLPVTVEFCISSFYDIQPLGRPRPWLDDHDVMIGNKGDMAWLPSYDGDFKKEVKMVLEKYGWPRGTVIAVKFQNEPWDGKSISGWGADVPRYREIYTAMAQAAEEARKDYGVEVMMGGCDSSSNTFDKFFADGKDTFLPWLDFCSIHYQGLNIPSTYKPWLQRTGPYGPVQIWETEGSAGEDKISAKVAAELAGGYDHVVAVWYGEDISPGEKKNKKGAEQGVNIWSPAASVGAVLHFIGQRKFDRLLFLNGLPWVMVFHGDADAQGKIDPEDETVVVVGDLGATFGHDNLPFRNVRGEKDAADVAKMRSQLATLPSDARKESRLLQETIRFGVTLSGATMTLANPAGAFHLYDIYGNEMEPRDGKTIVPLDQRGFFLRGDGKAGSFAALLDTIRHSRVDGIEPLAKKCHDMLSPVDKPGSTFRLELTNVLNRPVKGTLAVQVEGLKTDPASQEVAFGANETKVLPIKVSGPARPDNTYPMTMLFDAGGDGRTAHQEDLHVNMIARRTITVDGNLDDWRGVLPQTINVQAASGPTLAEKAWRPWEKFDEGTAPGLALGYLAYDDKYFYFAAKVADSNPDGGTVRMETRDEDRVFYPEISYELIGDKSLTVEDRVYREPDPKAPLTPDGKNGERAGTEWVGPGGAFAVDLDLPAGKATRISLYCVDHFGKGKTQDIVITDRQSGKVLDKRSIKDIGSGLYATYDMAGKIRITFSGSSKTFFLFPGLSALFLDPVPDSAHPAAPTGAQAQFVKFDKTTSGDWKGVYGSSGYKIAGQKDNLPAGVAVDFPREAQTKEFKWPEGVRRFSYARRDLSPWNSDSVQIAFNVLDPAKKDCLPCPPGTMPGFTGYKDTDYEYALYKVADAFGGGTEIWRDSVPGMPHKSFTPRSGKSPFDGAVKDGKLVVLQDATTRLVECAIPWSEIPEAKAKCDAGETVKFTFRVNYGRGRSGIELAHDRSVSKRNDFFTFVEDGGEHWANEIEFGFEK